MRTFLEKLALHWLQFIGNRLWLRGRRTCSRSPAGLCVCARVCARKYTCARTYCTHAFLRRTTQALVKTVRNPRWGNKKKTPQNPASLRRATVSLPTWERCFRGRTGSLRPGAPLHMALHTRSQGTPRPPASSCPCLAGPHPLGPPQRTWTRPSPAGGLLSPRPWAQAQHLPPGTVRRGPRGALPRAPRRGPRASPGRWAAAAAPRPQWHLGGSSAGGRAEHLSRFSKPGLWHLGIRLKPPAPLCAHRRPAAPALCLLPTPLPFPPATLTHR